MELNKVGTNSHQAPKEWGNNNRTILLNHAKVTLEKFTHDNSKANSLMSLISKAMPTTKEMSQNVGIAVADSYMTQISNWIIGTVAQTVFRIRTDVNRDWNSWLYKALSKPFLSGSGNMDPRLMPVLSLFGTVVGGVTIPTALAFAGLLYDRAYPDEEFKLESIPKLTDTYEVTKEGTIKNKDGKELTHRDIEDIKKNIAILDIIYRLLQSNPASLEQNLFIKREDGVYVYLDGKVIPSEKVNQGNERKKSSELKAIDRLMSLNEMKNEGAIIKFIHRLAKHTPQFQKGKYPLFIECSDGKICSPRGEIVSKDFRDTTERRIHADLEMLEKANSQNEAARAIFSIQADIRSAIQGEAHSGVQQDS
jgi:hypothetical protein